jgi:xanthine dehydrogenase/oxidase
MTIEEAILHDSFYPIFHIIESGNLAQEKTESDVVVHGTGRVGGQDHFYLETNCTVAFPLENDSLEIFSSAQNLTKTQSVCASICGIPASKVVAKCKRLGGGFGGKETKSVNIASIAALSAFLLNKPVSLVLDRDVDMSITGQRHAFFFKYSAGCSKDGKLKFLEAELYNNAGFSMDMSPFVMDAALFSTDNTYKWPSLKVSGFVCKTNQSSNTAFRGFGAPQGMMMTEFIIQHLAETMQIPPEVLKEQNLYRNNDRTHYGQTLQNYYVPMLWKQIHELADIEARKASVIDFNSKNRWKKRGLSVLPTKFGISFTVKFMNQV